MTSSEDSPNIEGLPKEISGAECRREGRATDATCYDPRMRKGAEVLVIGNEILTGKVQDVNGPFLIAGLREIGVELHRLTVLPDDLDLLASEIRRASASVEHVFTTGGVGPTLNDVTISAAGPRLRRAARA
jgi:molybdopterin-biosynthesis enzyme MoeA-like protein